MIAQTKTSELYNRISRHHGAMQEISQRTGVNRNTVRAHVSGKYKSPDADIIRVAFEVLREREAREKEALQMLAYQHEAAEYLHAAA
ncbi:MAG: hypothetical protein ACK4Q5_16580 [Saprospiraceae bacterium]